MKKPKIKKIARRIWNPIILISYLILTLWLVAMTVSFLEIYLYPGVVLKHSGIDPVFFYLPFGAAGFFWIGESLWESRPIRVLQKISLLTAIIFGLGYFAFNIIEIIQYQNFVFSTFHIHPQEMITPLSISVFSYLILFKNKLSTALVNPKFLFRKFPVTAILIWVLILNFSEMGKNVFRDLVFILENPRASYDKKMEEKVGKQFYNYVRFIKNNTPDDAKILIPPFPAYPWPQTGNIPYMTYFLYPRVLLNGEEKSPNFYLKSGIVDYVLIAWGETEATSGGFTHGWPKFDIAAQEIVYMDNGGLKIEYGDYLYKNVEGRMLWGIIKIKK